MTKSEVIDLVGQFGEIRFNGRYYPSIMHGTISEIDGDSIILTRLEGKPMRILIKGIRQFKAKRMRV